MNISRTEQLDMDKIVKNAGGNRFDLVVYGSALARKIANKNKENPKHVNAVMNALFEIQENYDAGKKV